MQFDNVMTLKKISLAAALFLFSLAAHCAEFTQLLCKAEESTTSYFPKGKAIEVPVKKLAEDGTEYVVRGWRFSNDIFRVSVKWRIFLRYRYQPLRPPGARNGRLRSETAKAPVLAEHGWDAAGFRAK